MDRATLEQATHVGHDLRMALRLLSRVVSSPLTVDGADTPLPTEFLIFKPGINETRKGAFLFDDTARAAVMAEYEAGGVQLCLDLEHDSLDPAKRVARADAADAMGWYDLALHSDGSLWAVNVKWSSEGERRLRNKLQRYTSPAFLTSDDDSTDRPLRLRNVALCAMPATLDAAPLVAATEGLLARLLSSANSQPRSNRMKPKAKKKSVQLSMSPEEAKQAVDVIASQDGNAALALVTALLATAAGGGDPAEPAADDTSVADLADPAPADAPKSPSSAPPPPDHAGPPDPKAKQMALSMLAELTGIPDAAKAIERFRSLSERMTKLAEDEATSDLTARRELIGKLVQLGYETPASAWEGKPEDRTPKARFLAESVPELRARVTDLEKRPVPGYQAPDRREQGSAKVVTLSDGREVSLTLSEIENCEAAGAKLEDFAANKATREAARRK